MDILQFSYDATYSSIGFGYIVLVFYCILIHGIIEHTMSIAGQYITVSVWRGQLTKEENMAALQSLTLGGSGQEILEIIGVLSRILVHLQAYREAHRAY